MLGYLLAVAEPAHENAVGQLMDGFGVQLNLLIAQIVNFCLVAYLFYRFALKPVLKRMEERRQKIADGLADAEAMKVQLAANEQKCMAAFKEAQEEAKQLVITKKSEMEQYVQSQKEAAQKEAAEILDQARDACLCERAKALDQVRAEASTLVVMALERLITDGNVFTPDMRQQLNQKAADALVETMAKTYGSKA